MTYSHAKVQDQRSVGSEDRVETNGRTNGGECITCHINAVSNKQHNHVVVVWLATDDIRGTDIDRIFVFWSPEACIADSMSDDGLSKVVSGNTQVSRGLYERGGSRASAPRTSAPPSTSIP